MNRGLGIALLTAILGTVAANAAADGFNIAWNMSWNAGGARIASMPCLSGGSASAVVTVKSDVTLSQVTAIEAVVDIVSNAPLPDAWQFQAGGCHATDLQIDTNTTPPVGSSPPTSPTTSYRMVVYPYDGSPTTERILIAVEPGDSNTPRPPTTLSAGVEYLAFRLQFSFDGAPDPCPGCGEQVAIIVRELRVVQNSSTCTTISTPLSNGYVATTPVNLGNIEPSACLTFGSTPLNLSGWGFQPGMVVRLVRSGESPIVATSVVVADQTAATCVVDLAGAAAGAWDVEMTNPDATTATAVGALALGSVLDGVWPRCAGIGQTVDFDIAGCGFQPGVQAELRRTGQPSILATATTILSPALVRGTFDLSGGVIGLWDVVVTNGAAEATLPKAVLLAGSTGTANLTRTLTVDRSSIRTGWTSTSHLDVRRLGSNSWTGMGFVRFRVSPIVNDARLGYRFGAMAVDAGTFTPTLLNVGDTDELVGLFTLPNVASCPPAIAYEVTAVPAPSWPIGEDVIVVCADLFQTSQGTGPAAGTALRENGAAVRGMWPVAVSPDFETSWFDALESEMATRTQQFTDDPATHVAYALHANLLSASMDAALDALESGYLADVTAYRAAWDDIKLNYWTGFVRRLGHAYDLLSPPLVSAMQFPMAGVCVTVDVVGSVDPNEKTGLAGASEEHYISDPNEMPYTIVFENLPSATAPAQTVRVTDQLDVSKFDLGTFQLGRIRFGATAIEPPPGLRRFATQVDLRPAQDMLVDVEVGLDPSTGLITGDFRSVDPTYGGPLLNPEDGFLPPDVDHPEGEGSISFTVERIAGLPTGTAIANQARIVFDDNAPIDTPVWSNTLDLDPPTSDVQPLAATQDAPAFAVTWSGSDAQSGIESYTVYCAADGGPYQVWLESTTATSGTFTGVAGSTYSFYSQARDRVDHVEAAPGVPDAMTLVRGGATGVIPPVFLSSWGLSGAGAGEFDQPEALAVGAGAIYVADFAANRIQKFTASGAYLLEWGSTGPGNGEFDGPSGVAVDATGSVYVTDYLNHRVQKFTSDGVFVTTWGDPGSGDGQFDRPDGIAVSPSGTVYVSDSFNHRVQSFTSAGSFLTAWGSFGTAQGQMRYPAGVAVDTMDNVYVSDANNHRIQKFTSTGGFLRSFGTQGSGPGQFNTPQGVSVDPTDNLFVADFYNNRVQSFTPQGQFLTQWGTFGTGEGMFNGASDVVVDDQFNVFVADLGNHRVQRFGRGSTAAEPAAPKSFAFSIRPNPARTARLSFDLPQGTSIELAVFDVQGRQVAKVFDGWLPAGRHSREWSGEIASGGKAGAGMYFYRIRAGENVKTLRGLRIE